VAGARHLPDPVCQGSSFFPLAVGAARAAGQGVPDLEFGARRAFLDPHGRSPVIDQSLALVDGVPGSTGKDVQVGGSCTVVLIEVY